MIATIKEFLQRYLEIDLEVRIQPSFFPFTEPDCEFVITVHSVKKWDVLHVESDDRTNGM